MNEQENNNDTALELSKKIIETIKKIRKEKGLSQADVANACGIPQPTYSELERGKQDFPLTRLLRVMQFLDIKAFEAESNPEPQNEEIAIVIKPEEIGNYFKALLINDAKQQQDISDIKRNHEKQQQDINEIKQMLKELIGKKGEENA